MSAGSLTATDVSTGNGSLSDLVTNINAAATGVTAAAVQTGTNQFVLQLSSSTTGTAADLSVDTSAFQSSSLGAMKTASAGEDAQIQVGGAGGYTISSGTNTFAGLLPGLSVTVQKTTSTPISVTVANDASTVASSVQTLVNDANTVLSDIQKYAGYNAQTKTGGPLMGSALLQNLTNQVLGTFASTVGTSTLGDAVNAGITLSNGTLNFDQNAFESAFTANPSQVQALFTQGGSFSPSSSSYTGQVTVNYASNTTRPGSYDVNITQSASQAIDSGAVLAGGTVSSPETLTLGMGGSTITYTTSAGQTLASITQGLNASFAANGMQLSAQVVNGNQLELRSDAYGSGTTFDVSSTGGAGGLGLTTGNVAGTDVAGTINGVTATGSGQYLTAPSSDPTLGGMQLRITASGISSATDLGTFTYTPGVAQTISNVSDAMSDPVTGGITQTIKGMQQQSSALTPQINFYTAMMSAQQKVLMAQYATLESTLGTLKNQSSSLASELSQLS
jgi:flagellar hook-associated protein 2